MSESGLAITTMTECQINFKDYFLLVSPMPLATKLIR
jgi:hypothetical protein